MLLRIFGSGYCNSDYVIYFRIHSHGGETDERFHDIMAVMTDGEEEVIGVPFDSYEKAHDYLDKLALKINQGKES